MKNNPYTLPRRALAAILLVLIACLALPANAGTSTWTGGGDNNLWSNPANWNVPPAANDSLIFTGTTRLGNTNNFAPGTAFNGISFNSVAGEFVLWGNAISLNGGLTNNQVVTEETVNLPIALSLTPTIQVITDASLRLGGVISGASFGLTKAGGGTLTLSAANTFGGPLVVNAGTVVVSSDANLGAVPASPTAGNITLDGGALRTTSSFGIDTNRGIAVGPASGSGSGRIEVNGGTTLSYGGIIANNGAGTGGLTKGLFGTLALSGANSYTGPTSNRVGTITLDFTQASAPASDIINAASSLSLGGENAGVSANAGTLNLATLLMEGRDGASNSQAFSSTFLDLGPASIRVNSGAGGEANLALGDVAHAPGSSLTIIPPAATGGLGNITTPATNVNGILGGWATYSDGNALNGKIRGTNWASVDVGGNIVPFSNFWVFPTGGQLYGNVTGESNVLIDATSTGDVINNVDLAGTVTDVNTIMIDRSANFSINVGNGNTLRLGRFGGIFRRAFNTITVGFGAGTTGGGNGIQNQGTLTAGGADNTPGEIVFTVNASSETAGSINTELAVTDNGTGPVTVIKTGPGPMKLRGHNTFSGGMYIIQGRIQMAGTELSASGGTGNPDGFGTGPCFVLPGGQAFPSGAGGLPITNDWFIAGNGVSDQVGAIRLSGVFSNKITLIGDARLGGGGFTGVGVPIRGQITGPFNLDFGATGNSGGGANQARLFNQSNDWTGNTTIVGRTGTAGNTRLSLGTNDVIPDGFGKGNLIFGNAGNASSQVVLDLNGFNETVNGLNSIAPTHDSFTRVFIENRATATTATLTIGNNDQSGSFRGIMRDAPGIFSLRKIGGGVQTLFGTNTYTGNTVIDAGTLALGDIGSISSSASIIVNSGGTFDPSAVTGGFTTANTVSLDGGTFIGNTSTAGIGALNLTNGNLTLRLNTLDTNVYATALNTAGTNLINIKAVLNVLTYPTQFVALKYTSQSGDANFGFGTVPNAVTGGYISNDTSLSAIVVVLTNGPQTLTWAGNDPVNPTFWDVNTTSNFLDSVLTSVPFNQADSVVFANSASTNTIEVVGSVLPSQMTFLNSVDYTFTGSGAIGGEGPLIKSGAGAITFMNSGGDSYIGGVSVNAGSITFASDNGISGGVTIAGGARVQVGTNGGTGTLPSGGVVNNGDLVFSRGANLTVANTIGGSSVGTILKTNDTAVLTLSGNNTFTGAVLVASGTLQAGNNGALGRTNGATTIAAGATLDVNSFSLGFEPVIVSGDGLGGLGAIINTGAAELNALRSVTLTADTAFGGNERWDIRETPAGANNASLSGSFTLSKVGTNQVSLVGVSAGSLGDILVKEGTLGIEMGTALGSSSITVSNGASLLFFSNSVVVTPNLQLHGDGAVPSVLLDAGSVTLSGTVTINGPTIFSGDSVGILNNVISGTGDLIKTGTSRLVLNAPASYVGNTIVSNGTLIIDGGKSGGTGITVEAGGALGGGGSTVSESVTVNGGGITPGNPNSVAQEILTIGSSLTMTDSTNLFELSPSTLSGNDMVTVFGDLTLAGTNRFRISVTDHLTVGDIYTLVSYFGAGNNVTTNTVVIVPPTFGYELALIDPATTPGEIRVQVLVAIGFDIWLGNNPVNPTRWDNGVTTNWLKSGVNSAFTNGDFAHFSDFVPGFVGSSTNITLFEQLSTAGVIFSNSSAAPFSFVGAGGLSGGGFVLEGEGPVRIANSGTNDFTGGALIDFNSAIFFNAATLIVGSGTNGNLGGGAITNRGALLFDRTGFLTVSNSISGTGGITNLNTGEVTLTAASTFTGPLEILKGTIVAGNADALGASNATYVVTNATLDVGGQNLGDEWVVVGGSGTGGQGAIINSGPSATSALLNVVLTTNTVFGGVGVNDPADGTNRWDIRAEGGFPGQLLTDPPGSAYSLTKVGGNTVCLVGVTNIDPMLADIDIQGGVFGIQTTTTQVGNPTNTITIHSNAMLNVWDLSQSYVNKQIVMKNGSTYWSDSGESTNIGPVTLESGSVTILNDGGTLLRFESNSISGPATLVKIGGGVTALAGTVAYTGNTVISNGTLTLIGSVSLDNSALIDLAASNTTPTIDVLERTDGTLTVNSGQTLRGAGAINGSLAINAGGTLSLGSVDTVGTLTVTNPTAVTLGGATSAKVDAATVTSDRLVSATNSLVPITYGGTLNVSNLGGTLAGGQTYKLFDAASYAGSFTTVNLPALGAGMYWTNNLNVDGTITVISTIQPQPLITSIEIIGGSLVIRGTNNNGAVSGTVYVLCSTNLLTPLSNWTVLSTNAFDGSGSLNYTNGAASEPQQFYLLQLP